MLQSTLDLIRAALKVDSTLTPADRNKIVALLRKGEDQPAPKAAELRVLSRSETARRFGRSLRFVDKLAREKILQRVTLPGRLRACGFREPEVSAVIAGGFTTQE